MKKLFLFAICVMALLVSCTKQVQEEPFNAGDVDSITVKDGADNDTRISVICALDSTAYGYFFNEKELSQFYGEIVSFLRDECRYPRTFKPLRVYSVKFKDTIDYRGITIYKIEAFLTGYAKNGFGVESDITEIFDLIAWRDVERLPANEEQPERDWAYWFVMKDRESAMKSIEHQIDRVKFDEKEEQ